MSTTHASPALEDSVAITVAYFDVFDFAPSAAQIHRFLIGHKATPLEVSHALETSPRLAKLLEHEGEFWFLRGKAHLAPRRVRFRESSQKLWQRARAAAKTMARLRLATCGMVTGSLSLDNADEHADVDFLFVYPAPRAWSSYALIRLVSKVPRLGEHALCPNYILLDDALEVRPQNLFTALEVAKAVPMFGFDTYERFLQANQWVSTFLPNAFGMARRDLAGEVDRAQPEPAWLSPLWQSSLFQRIEQAERQRKHRHDARDVGVDMQRRAQQRSSDRHSPTRSYHALSELRYRLGMLGITEHPMYQHVLSATNALGEEMRYWGQRAL